MSRRGTTPTQTFELPFNTSLIREVIISYVQRGKVLFDKRRADCTFEGNIISFRLTQEETFMFDDKHVLTIEMRFIFEDGTVDAANDIITSVDGIYNEEVMV